MSRLRRNHTPDQAIQLSVFPIPGRCRDSPPGEGWIYPDTYVELAFHAPVCGKPE